MMIRRNSSSPGGMSGSLIDIMIGPWSGADAGRAGRAPAGGDRAAGSVDRVDAPVACLIGIGQGRASHRVAEPHGVELGGLRRQAGLDVAQRRMGAGSSPCSAAAEIWESVIVFSALNLLSGCRNEYCNGCATNGYKRETQNAARR